MYAMRRLSRGNTSVAVDTGIGAGDGIVVGKTVGIPCVEVGNGSNVAVAGGAVMVGNAVGAALGVLVGVESG
jgi:hypothetical protein